MKSLLLIALTVLLAACNPVRPDVRVVEVPVACVKNVPVRPDLVHDTLNAETPLDELYSAAIQDKLALQGYANSLEVEVKACATIPAQK